MYINCIIYLFHSIFIYFVELFTSAPKIIFKISDKPITVKPFISDLAFQWRLATSIWFVISSKRKIRLLQQGMLD